MWCDPSDMPAWRVTGGDLRKRKWLEKEKKAVMLQPILYSSYLSESLSGGGRWWKTGRRKGGEVSSGQIGMLLLQRGRPFCGGRRPGVW